MRVRNKRALTAALTATLAVLAAASGPTAGPASAQSNPSSPKPLAASVRVMDWNIHGGTGTDGVYDFDRIVDVIRAEDPDIVTLQEVSDNRAVGGDNQWQLLLDAFPEYEAHFACSDYNGNFKEIPAPQPGEPPIRLHGTAGNLILSRFPIEEKLTHPLPPYTSDSPEDRDCPTGGEPASPVRRSMGGVRVDVGGTDVRVYTTHWSPGRTQSKVDRRQAQARETLDTMPASRMTTPMLFTGDHNLKPDGTIRSWIAEAGWYDTWTQLEPNIGGDVVTHPGGSEEARIDYVYASAGFDVDDVHVVQTNASDHLPVVVDLTIRDTRPVQTGSVLAGAKGRAGWAHLSMYENNSAKIRVCDNKPDGWGVRAYLYDDTLSDGLVVTGSDGAYADRCGTFNTRRDTVAAPLLRVCLYKGGEEKDCREQRFS